MTTHIKVAILVLFIFLDFSSVSGISQLEFEGEKEFKGYTGYRGNESLIIYRPNEIYCFSPIECTMFGKVCQDVSNIKFLAIGEYNNFSFDFFQKITDENEIKYCADISLQAGDYNSEIKVGKEKIIKDSFTVPNVLINRDYILRFDLDRTATITNFLRIINNDDIKIINYTFPSMEKSEFLGKLINDSITSSGKTTCTSTGKAKVQINLEPYDVQQWIKYTLVYDTGFSYIHQDGHGFFALDLDLENEKGNPVGINEFKLQVETQKKDLLGFKTYFEENAIPKGYQRNDNEEYVIYLWEVPMLDKDAVKKYNIEVKFKHDWDIHFILIVSSIVLAIVGIIVGFILFFLKRSKKSDMEDGSVDNIKKGQGRQYSGVNKKSGEERIFHCPYCDFSSKSKKGIKVHQTRKKHFKKQKPHQ